MISRVCWFQVSPSWVSSRVLCITMFDVSTLHHSPPDASRALWLEVKGLNTTISRPVEWHQKLNNNPNFLAFLNPSNDPKLADLKMF